MKYRRRRPNKLLVVLILLAVAGLGAWYWSGHHAKTAKKLPTPDTAASRDAIRRLDLAAIGDALNRYTIDHTALPIALPTADTEICSTSGTACRTAHLVDLNFLVNPGSYMASLPSDPTGGHARYSLGFTLARDAATGKLRLTAPRTEGGPAIVVLK
jgi:hypothetical protein